MKWQETARRLMREQGITQAAIAEKLGVTQGAFGHWLNNRRDPGIDGLRRIAEALGVSLPYLVGSDLDSPGSDPSLAERSLSTEGTAEGPATYSGVGAPQVPVRGAAELTSEGGWSTLVCDPTGNGVLRFLSSDMGAYAIRVIGEGLSPRIRHGEFIVVEPRHGHVPGDEVLVRIRSGQSMIAVYKYERDGLAYLESVNDAKPMTLAVSDIDGIYFVAAVVKSLAWIKG